MDKIKNKTAFALAAILGALFAAPASAQEMSAMGGAAEGPTVREISAKQAELQMLELEAKIHKARQPMLEEEAKVNAAQLQAQLERAAAQQQASAVQEVAMSASVLSIYGMGSDLTAEMKVGDMLMQVKRGAKLPNGMFVERVGENFVELSRAQGKKRVYETIYISGTESASVYSSRGKGADAGSAAPVPSGLPPLPGR